jgi:hypothetical protein
MRSLLNAAIIGLMISSTPAQALDCVVWYRQPFLDQRIDRTAFIFQGVKLRTLAEGYFPGKEFTADLIEVRVDQIFKGGSNVAEGDTIKIVVDGWCSGGNCKPSVPTKEDRERMKRHPHMPQAEIYFVHEVPKPLEGRVGDWRANEKGQRPGVKWRPAIGVKWDIGVCGLPLPFQEWVVNLIKQRLASTIGQLE